jgi:hypothetical protein
MSSTVLPIPEDQKVEAWGHQYCISAFRSDVLMVSGGPNATSFSCAEQLLQAPEIEAAHRTIFQARSGEVVVIVAQSEIT